jgi:hypothetical protein
VLSILLGLARALFGLAAYAAPDVLTEKALMPEAATSADGRYMTRLFGARDLVIGVLTVATRTRTTALAAGVACDLLDTASGVVSAREGKDVDFQRKATAVAAIFAVLGIAAIKRAH